jgi:regulator of protease activity HflC (stomatin/prohibitin superfamily)
MNWLDSIFKAIKGAFTWWVTVAPWEQALRVRLGKRVHLLKPGVHMRFPVLDRIYRQSTRLRSGDIPIQTVTTNDGHTVTLAGCVWYQIEDIRKLYETLHHGQDILIDMAAAAIAEAVSSRTKEECTIKVLEAAVTERLQFKDYGINQTSVRITDFAFVTTIRLIQDGKRYASAWEDALNTMTEEKGN